MTTKTSRKTLLAVLEVLLEDTQIKRTTKIDAPDLTVKATRQHTRFTRKNERSTTVLLTIGQPNYAERQIIKKHKARGGKFPITDIFIQWKKNTNHCDNKAKGCVKAYRRV